jgi:drug/metabolite transporter (DMT)-like permease
VLQNRRPALAAAFVAVAPFLWGLWPLALRNVGLVAAAAALVGMAVQAIPAPFLAWRERKGFRDRGAVLAVLVFGVFDAFQCALYFPALARGPVSVAALTHYIGPVLVALAAGFVPGERTSRRALVAAPLSLLGLLLVLGPPRQAPVLTAVLGAGSAFFGAGCLFAVRRAGRSFSPMAVATLHGVIAGPVLLAVFRAEAIPPWGAGVARMAVAGAVLGLGALMIFIRAIRHVPAPIAATISYVEPVTAAAVGALVLGEPLGRVAILGAAVVIGAGIWVAFEPGPVPTPAREERRAA